MFKNITVGVDGSDHAARALDVACDLAKRYDGQIHLVHTPEITTSVLAVGVGTVAIPAEVVADSGQDVMDDAVARMQDSGIVPASKIVVDGVPSTEVIKAATKTGSDLIVTGRRGVGSVQNLLMGSTSQQIAKEAPCALLTVK